MEREDEELESGTSLAGYRLLARMDAAMRRTLVAMKSEIIERFDRFERQQSEQNKASAEERRALEMRVRTLELEGSSQRGSLSTLKWVIGTGLAALSLALAALAFFGKP